MTTARARAHSAGRLPSKEDAGPRPPGRARFMGVPLIPSSLIPAALSYLVLSTSPARYGSGVPEGTQRPRHQRKH